MIVDILYQDQTWIIFAMFFIAAFIKGATGLGFSTLCMAMLALYIGVKEALPLVLIPSLVSNMFVMKGAGYFKETLKQFWLLLAFSIPGVFVGLSFLVWFDPSMTSIALGGVLISYVLFAFLHPDFRLPASFEKPLAPFVGLLTGVVNGLTGSQVMPVMPYLLSMNLSVNRFIQAINCSFSLSSVMMVIGLANLGYLNWEAAIISLIGLIPVGIGVRIGATVREILLPDTFKRIVLFALLFMGVGLCLKHL